MGMFDTFYHDDAKICCPNCNTRVEMKFGIQTKNFENLLYDYFRGDVVDGVSDDDTFVLEHDYCTTCNTMFEFVFCFKSRIFVGIYQTIDEATNALEKFDVIEHYRKMYHEKTKFEHRYLLLRQRIQSTIKIHGDKSVKNTFNRLLPLHNSFVDYNIIKTLKNIVDRCDSDD